ncbi:Hpt domain-containing protein [Exilibacterium tricleocarpae]|uniref:Hpt domain-containing protein n=1 Tax=Exilibacterium tricleocarpae TaxID=2591008 RepID=A0A545U400_9GAMM|nr:Hpt domain-containing protein [Exilibacterium tricleocarpae]TQV84180.1 Hpt domain-containing protein [Exilibacterium tricleocarpae]
MSTEIHIDKDTLMTLKEVMEEEFQLLIDTFLSDAEQRLAALRDCLARADSTGLRAAAHSFKGSCSNIGAPLMAQLCARVEDAAVAGELDGLAPALDAIEAEHKIVVAALGEL